MRPLVIQISDRRVVSDADLVARIDGLRGASRFAVQLRDPQLATSELLDLAADLRERTHRAGASLVVNDRLDVAIAVAADGVHLGRRSVAVADVRAAVGDRVWISRSAHDLDQALTAARQGADAVLLSPIFASPGKTEPVGLEALRFVRERLPASVALYALGGVDQRSARSCLQAGADGVASIRADLTALLR